MAESNSVSPAARLLAFVADHQTPPSFENRFQFRNGRHSSGDHDLAVNYDGRSSHHPEFQNLGNIRHVGDIRREIEFSTGVHDVAFRRLTIGATRPRNLDFHSLHLEDVKKAVANADDHENDSRDAPGPLFELNQSLEDFADPLCSHGNQDGEDEYRHAGSGAVS